MKNKLRKEELRNLIDAERNDVVVHKVLKYWKSRHGFYWVRSRYSVRTGFTNFNVREDEIQVGNIPYPLAEFRKLSSKDQVETAIVNNIDEPISLGYLLRKIKHGF